MTDEDQHDQSPTTSRSGSGSRAGSSYSIPAVECRMLGEAA
jgi:hypothetical protein